MKLFGQVVHEKKIFKDLSNKTPSWGPFRGHALFVHKLEAAYGYKPAYKVSSKLVEKFLSYCVQKVAYDDNTKRAITLANMIKSIWFLNSSEILWI